MPAACQQGAADSAMNQFTAGIGTSATASASILLPSPKSWPWRSFLGLGMRRNLFDLPPRLPLFFPAPLPLPRQVKVGMDKLPKPSLAANVGVNLVGLAPNQDFKPPIFIAAVCPPFLVRPGIAVVSAHVRPPCK